MQRNEISTVLPSGPAGPRSHRHAAPLALAALAAYNVVQNTPLGERVYLPANLLMGAGLVAFARRSGSSWSDLGLDASTAGPGLRLGAQVGAGTAVALTAALASSATRRMLLDQRAHGHTPASVVYRSMVRFPMGTALFEEVAFRGVLESLWRRTSGERTARLVSAVAFGAWHLLPTYRLYPGMPVGRSSPGRAERALAALGSAAVTGLAGVSFSWLRRSSDSVVAPWLAHASYNSLGFVAAWTAWRIEHMTQ